MSVFDELITDRTRIDVINRTPKGFIAYTDLNRVEEACAELAEHLGVDINTKTDWAMSDFRTDSDMDRIRGNINKLRGSFYVLPTTPPTPTKIRYQDVTEANNIEQILLDMYTLWESTQQGTHRLSFKLGTKQLGDRHA